MLNVWHCCVLKILNFTWQDNFVFQAQATAPADINGADEACATSDIVNDSDQILLDGVPVEESLFDEDDLELDDLDINDWIH